MILVLTDPADLHADYVAGKLQERGAAYVRFNPAQFPTAAAMSLAYNSCGDLRAVLRTNDSILDSSIFSVVWYRRPRAPVPHPDIQDAMLRDSASKECESLIYDFLNLLSCRFVPAPRLVLERAQFKASQLQVAGSLGFELPPTLFTTSPSDALAFYRAHDGRIISKPAGSAFYRATGDGFWRYTEVVSPRDIDP